MKTSIFWNILLGDKYIDFAEDFKNIVKEDIAPYLKELGFKKQRNNFLRPINDFVQVFNVQQSSYNFPHDKSFTFNLGFYNEEIFIETQEREVPDFPKTYNGMFSIRISTLMNSEKDKWFKLNRATNIRKLKKEIRNVMKDYIIPFFTDYTRLEDFYKLIETDESIRIRTHGKARIILHFKFGKREQGEKELKDWYDSAKKYSVSKGKITYPDGRQEEVSSEPYVNKDNVKLLGKMAKNYNVSLINNDNNMQLDLSKIQTRRQFMDWFRENFNFPDYFGSNWDAVDECLYDFCTADITINILNKDKMSEEIAKQYPIFESVIEDFNKLGKIKITLQE